MKVAVIISLLIFSFSVNAQTTFCLLNGSNSVGAGSYHWNQVSGPGSILRSPDSASCRVDSLTQGVRLYELTCINHFGVSKDSVMITVIKAPVYSATITSAICTRSFWNDVLSWNVSNESNVSYYLLEKGSGSSFSQVTAVLAKGNGKYTYSVFRLFTSKPQYRVTPIFRNGTKGIAVLFK